MSFINNNIENTFFGNANVNKNEPTKDSLSEHIQQLRKMRGWSLEQASKEIDLSRSAIIKIEKGQMSPTFDTIKKIAAGFNISVTQLLAPPPEEGKITARCTVTRNNEGEIDAHQTERQEFVAAAILDKKMLPYKGIIKARSIDEMKHWTSHDGEEFMIVLSGQVAFCTEYYKESILNPGDSVYFDAQMGHFTYSLSENEAEVLWVTTR